MGVKLSSKPVQKGNSAATHRGQLFETQRGKRSNLKKMDLKRGTNREKYKLMAPSSQIFIGVCGR